MTQRTADRGGSITVSGSGFGDNCYATGQPPPGEGSLGRPQPVEILFVQDDRRVVVARGSADDSYGFEVPVPVPSDVHPGWATITARIDANHLSAPGTNVTISDRPAIASSSDMISFVGTQILHGTIPARASDVPPPTRGDDSPAPRQRGLLVALIGFLVIIVLTVTVGATARRRTAGRSGS